MAAGNLFAGSVLGSFEGNVDDFIAALRRAERETKSGTKKMSSIWRGVFERIGHRAVDTMIGLTRRAIRAVVQEIKSAIERAIEFEKALGEIGTLGEFSLHKIRKEILELSREMGVAAIELAKGWYQAISASVPLEEVKDFMRTATKLAIAGLAQIRDTVDVLTSVVNAYGREVLSAEHASDVLFQTVKRGKLTLSELVPVMGRIAPLAAAMKVSFEEVMASIAKLTRIGMPVHEAVTHLKALYSFILRMKKGGTEAAKSFKQSGSEVIETLKEISTRVGRSTINWNRFLRDLRRMRPLIQVGKEVGISINEINKAVQEVAQRAAPSKAFAKVHEILKLMSRDAQNFEMQLKRAGMTMKDAFDFLTAEITSGRSPYQAMRRLNQALEAMVGKAVDFKKALGGEKSVVQILNDMVKQGADLKDVMGANVEALAAGLGMMTGGIGDLRSDMKAMAEDEKVVAEAYAKMEETTARNIERMLALHEEFLIRIGTELLPQVNRAIQSLSRNVETLIGYIQKAVEWIDVLAQKRTWGIVGEEFIPALNPLAAGWRAYQLFRPRSPAAGGTAAYPERDYPLQPWTPEAAPISVMTNANPFEIAHEIEQLRRVGHDQPSMRGVL